MVLARRALVFLIGLVYAAVAIANVVAPHEAARAIGLAAMNINGLNELRAVYVGVWLATAAISLLAARRPEDASLHLAITLLVGGQVLGRLVSVLVDGPPTMELLPMATVEVMGVIVLVVVRPRRTHKSVSA